MSRLVHTIIFFITFALAVCTLAACSSALVKRNNEIGHATALAATQGVKVILSTNSLTQPGYALSTGACGIIINSLILMIYTLHLLPLTNFLRKIFFLTPLALLLNTLLVIGSGIAVTRAARNDRLGVYATLGNTVLPPSIFDQQAEKLGLSVYFWGKDYVKFMAIVPWALMPFAIATTYLAYTYWKVERPSAYRQRQTVESSHALPRNEEKSEVSHLP